MTVIESLKYQNIHKSLYLAKTIHTIFLYINVFREPKARCVGIVKAYKLMAKGFQKNNAKKM